MTLDIFKDVDTVKHNIIAINSDRDADDLVFDKPGEYKIRCNIPPSMKLKLTVK
jgi:plastocyanin